MSGDIPYGVDSVLALDLAPDLVLADCGCSPGSRGPDVIRQVVSAMADPLGFPPISQATIPGDRVAVVVGEGVPQVRWVVAAVVGELLRVSRPEMVTVVCAPSDHSLSEEDLAELIVAEDRDRVELIHHDPHDREGVAYVAANERAQPIYLNRAIVDADFVVPVGCLRSDDAADYLGVHNPLFPRFADERTQRRFRDPEQACGGLSRQRQQRQEVDEAAWLLGVQFTLQIVPGAQDTVLHVLSGLAQEVAIRGKTQNSSGLEFSVPGRAGLVVATIDGGPEQQTWENLARALAAAGRVVADDGVIAVCCDLDTPPGAALSCLAEFDVTEVALREIDRQRAADALPAAWLLHVLDRHTVFLLSRLDEPVVEDLGMAPLASAEDLARLSLQFDSCITLRGAHRIVPTAATDMADVEAE